MPSFETLLLASPVGFTQLLADLSRSTAPLSSSSSSSSSSADGAAIVVQHLLHCFRSCEPKVDIKQAGELIYQSTVLSKPRVLEILKILQEDNAAGAQSSQQLSISSWELGVSLASSQKSSNAAANNNSNNNNNNNNIVSTTGADSAKPFVSLSLATGDNNENLQLELSFEQFATMRKEFLNIAKEMNA